MDERWHAARRLSWQSLAILGVLAGYHLALRWLMQNTGLVLGAVGPGTKVYRIVPLYMYVAPHFKTGLLLAIGVMTAYWFWLRAFAWHTERLRRGFVPAAMLWYFGLACAVAMVDGGLDRLWRPYELMHDTEYLGAVDQVQSVRQFLHDYVALLPGLPLHCHTHPPGGVIFLWWVDRLIHPGAPTAALATIAAAGLSVPAVYLLAREVLDERGARLSTALFLVTPSVLLYTATSMDAVFITPLIWTIFLLWKARSHRPWLLGALAGLTASIGVMLTFSAAFVVFWAAAMLAVTAIADRPRLARVLQSFVSVAAVSVVFFLVVFCWCGYNPLDNLHASIAFDHAMMSGGNPAASRPHAHLIVANLVAFLSAAGIPLLALFVRQAWQDCRGGQRASPGRWLNLTYLAALAVTVAAPLYTLEVERIWLFMVPLVVIASVRGLETRSESDRPEAERPGSEVGLVFGLLAAQVVLMETLLETTW